MTAFLTQWTKDAQALHDKVAKSHPKLERGQVWCRACGATQMVNTAGALRNGWPKCPCNGHTMTIDSPEEQAKLR